MLLKVAKLIQKAVGKTRNNVCKSGLYYIWEGRELTKLHYFG